MVKSGLALIDKKWIADTKTRIESYRSSKAFSKARADSLICDVLPLTLAYIEDLMGTRLGTHVVVPTSDFEEMEAAVAEMRVEIEEMKVRRAVIEELEKNVVKGEGVNGNECEELSAGVGSGEGGVQGSV